MFFFFCFKFNTHWFGNICFIVVVVVCLFVFLPNSVLSIKSTEKRQQKLNKRWVVKIKKKKKKSGKNTKYLNTKIISDYV